MGIVIENKEYRKSCHIVLVVHIKLSQRKLIWANFPRKNPKHVLNPLGIHIYLEKSLFEKEIEGLKAH